MLKKAPNLLFKRQRCPKIIASRQVEVPFHNSIGRQRRKGFCAIAVNIGRTAIPFFHRNDVPATKRMGVYLGEFTVPENAAYVI